MPSLVDIMSQVSAQLSASMEASRMAFSHNLTKGEAVEEALRQFLRNHLPASIGVTHGQVIDRHGAISKQLDVILYDAQRTPILFSDAAANNQILPVEGVVAAIECKTNLRTSEVPDLAQSAELLKSLDKTAYYLQDNPVIRSVKTAYGKEWDALPVFYFVFAFDGPSIDVIGNAVKVEHQNRELEERIDMVCVMNSGVVVNGNLPLSGIDAIPFPGSHVLSSQTKHPLLFFYILMCRYVLQAQVPPIAVQRYIPDGFAF
ncbi:hypothetical protein LWF01_04040 [Saxibacter everestensis]|uniref:DUF6602 domain-containing protein n=1 Tax=Saxibacter everestensis TaxID=2909229 RepID=A0ABY8QVW1_9MICO|nr:hypothetical protein LWF01_04040 [Brevibacteriaceae bacterium ZFBP1038]